MPDQPKRMVIPFALRTSSRALAGRVGEEVWAGDMYSIVLCVGTVGICKIEEDLPVRPTCRCLGLAVCLSLSIAALSTSLGIGLGLCICLCSCKESNSLFKFRP